MLLPRKKRIVPLHLLVVASFFILTTANGQTSEAKGESGHSSNGDEKDKKGSFEWGLTVGVHFAGDRSAGFYNGDHPKGRIERLLNRSRIRKEIRNELQKDFSFSGYTPPSDMSYKTSYAVGTNFRYMFGKAHEPSIQGELLFSRLKTRNFFYLSVKDPNKAVAERKPYPVEGAENRFLFSLDLHDEGSGKPFRPYYGVGLTVGYADAIRNRISIGGLSYPILPSDDPRYGAPEVQKGVVLGGQGELGLKLRTGKEWDLSLSGKVSYSKVDIGADPAFDLQGAVYFRLIRTSL
ncbi:MAG: hypothetical protein ABEH38_03905 [Flavobacteriales bacterium]